jgi:hypothetical protein
MMFPNDQFAFIYFSKNRTLQESNDDNSCSVDYAQPNCRMIFARAEGSAFWSVKQKV